MDVLLVGRELHLAGLHIRQDPVQSRLNGGNIILRDDALFPQHFRMGLAPGDILPVQPLVKADGLVQLVHQLVRLLLKTPAPKFHVSFSSL